MPLTAEFLKAYAADVDLVEADQESIDEAPSKQARTIYAELPFAGLAVVVEGEAVAFRPIGPKPGFVVERIPLAKDEADA